MFFKKRSASHLPSVPRTVPTGTTYPCIDVMAEYGAGPVWLTQSAWDVRVPVSPFELHLSNTLAEMLQSWQDEYDATLNQDYPP